MARMGRVDCMLLGRAIQAACLRGRRYAHGARGAIRRGAPNRFNSWIGLSAPLGLLASLASLASLSMVAKVARAGCAIAARLLA